MRLNNFLLVVRNIERSKAFYKELFGMTVVRDFGENVILGGGLVLQEEKTWETAVGQQIFYGSHNTELYFEEPDWDSFLKKLKQSSFPIEYLNEETESSWGNRMVRIYDPDKHILEIREVT